MGKFIDDYEEEWTINRIYNECTDQNDDPKERLRIARKLYCEATVEELEEIADNKALWKDYQENFVSRYGNGETIIDYLREFINKIRKRKEK